jgi:hypothetical protein
MTVSWSDLLVIEVVCVEYEAKPLLGSVDAVLDGPVVIGPVFDCDVVALLIIELRVDTLELYDDGDGVSMLDPDE